MKKYRSTIVLAMLIILFVTAAVGAESEDIRIVAPYLGYVANVYEEHGLNLDDSKLMKGLYFQWINPDRYQWNTFLYQASDINYSTLWGGHFIFDYYFGVQERGKFVVGTGIEYIRLDMDAGDNLPAPITAFEMLNNIIVPYARFGRYFTFGNDRLSVSLLPWAGVQPQWVRGNLSSGPPLSLDDPTDDYQSFGIAGINTSVSIFHFITVDAKYRGTFNADDYFSTVDSMVNVFFTRHWGLSYRFKYGETSSGSTSYHIGGIAYVF